jgi:hypothetical protein
MISDPKILRKFTYQLTEYQKHQIDLFHIIKQLDPYYPEEMGKYYVIKHDPLTKGWAVFTKGESHEHSVTNRQIASRRAIEKSLAGKIGEVVAK